jgi:hypothetical protein
MAAAVPLVLLALALAGGGHTWPFGHSPAEDLLSSSMVGAPVLLFLIGGSLLWGSRTGRYAPTLVLVLLIPVDVVAGMTAVRWLNQPPPHADFTPAAQPKVIRNTIIMAPQAPTLQRIECDPTSRRCGGDEIQTAGGGGAPPFVTAPPRGAPAPKYKRWTDEATSVAKP